MYDKIFINALCWQKKIIFCLALFLSCSFAPLKGESPSALYLTWVHDPATTIVVNWQTAKNERDTLLKYRVAGGGEWRHSQGEARRLSDCPFLLHSVELQQLEADREYEFQIGSKEAIYRFRTMPVTLDRPVRFAVGGDAYYYLSLFRKTNAQIAACDPDFVVVGGDIAYVEGTHMSFSGKKWKMKRWRAFLQEWKRQMVTSDGRLIPIVPVLGNHDVHGIGLDPHKHKQYFYEFFSFPEDKIPYRAIDFGDYLSLVILDSGHSYPIKGVQTQWLKETLAERENLPYTMALYHVGAFPAFYPYKAAAAALIRKEWVPLFERYQINLAFEHHSHTYKRTYPIKGEKIDASGIIYLGDGSWGVKPRKPREDLWYTAKIKQCNCFYLVLLQKEACKVKAFNNKGMVFDEICTFPKSASRSYPQERLLKY